MPEFGVSEAGKSLRASSCVFCVPAPRTSHLPPLVPFLQAVTHYNNPKVLAEVSGALGEAMVGIDIREKGFNSYAGRSE